MEQALDYFPGLKERELPKYILVSDFEQFKLYDLDEDQEHQFTLSELINNIHLFGFIAGREKRTFKEEDPVNLDAAYLMGKLHDELEAIGYEGYAKLEIYLKGESIKGREYGRSVSGKTSNSFFPTSRYQLVTKKTSVALTETDRLMKEIGA